jgi:hypothetical protein
MTDVNAIPRYAIGDPGRAAEGTADDRTVVGLWPEGGDTNDHEV